MPENALPRDDDLELQDVEIEPLTDEALEEVAGGIGEAMEAADSCCACCSCSMCSA